MLKIIYTLEDLKDITEDITELYFAGIFNESIDGLIPFWIKKIGFDYYGNFNKTCEMLPEGLEELRFNYSKYHTIEEIRNLPKGLKVLEIGRYYGILTKDDLPKELEKFEFDKYITKVIQNNNHNI